ncbi:Hypothetical predicted protein, partial [Mytilus galloprovincialis]
MIDYRWQLILKILNTIWINISNNRRSFKRRERLNQQTQRNRKTQGLKSTLRRQKL